MLSIKINKVVPMDDMKLLVSFENGSVKQFDVGALSKDCPEFEVLRDPAIFQCVEVEPGGYGIAWNDELDCSEGELWENSIDISSK